MCFYSVSSKESTSLSHIVSMRIVPVATIVALLCGEKLDARSDALAPPARRGRATMSHDSRAAPLRHDHQHAATTPRNGSSTALRLSNSDSCMAASISRRAAVDLLRVCIDAAEYAACLGEAVAGEHGAQLGRAASGVADHERRYGRNVRRQ